ncbi:MAG: Mur ligase domain-containing protein, partial [Bacteroidia bacterium]|nr:Mur ligase domain-containing protein [Bacteroidia bacterium]
MKLTSRDIANIVKGKLTGNSDLAVRDLVTDSRQLSFTEGLAFFAIRGKNHDGHLFIKSLFEKGIRTFVVEKLPDDHGSYNGAGFIEVKNTITALQDLAAHKRKDFKSPVVAVTGSAGKT